MQEVFEKIIEKLEEENRRLKTVRNNCIALSDSEVNAIENKAYNFAIEIVKQAAAEYNNGWIPCSERLPEEYTVLCCDKYGEIIVGHPYFDEVSDTNYSAESDNEMMYNCVAWQPLPLPFRDKE